MKLIRYVVAFPFLLSSLLTAFVLTLLLDEEELDALDRKLFGDEDE